MADIDDDLLDLAGGMSEDETSGNESRGMSESPPPAKAKDSKKGSARKPRRRTQDDGSDEEEGEASSAPGTPNSLESAPMEESDSDAEPSRGRTAAVAGGDDDNKYPVDGMYVSQAEKAEIMAMREVEREQLIADRVSEIERQRQNRLLRQMVTSAENEERKQVKKKRSADTAELDDGQERSSRPRRGETAMDSLRRARAEKQRRREDQDRRRDAFSPGARGSPEAEESDDDYGRPRSRTPKEEAPRDAPPPELRDYERLRLGRNEFAQVCFTPGFEAAITGCYIRIALGPHPETGIEQYRMAVIKGFTTGRPYALNGPNGTFVTDQYVKAAHGKAVKEFPFIAASSGKFTEGELNRYQVTCNNEEVKLPLKAVLADKVDDINRLINHKWTNEDIKARLARKNDLRRRFDPAEREKVARLLEEARERGDEQKVEELQAELDKLGTQRLAFKTTLGPTRNFDSPKSGTEQDRLAERNRENRRLNVEGVRKAQLKEKARAREIELALKRGEQVEDDPSRRLRTKAKFVYDVNDSAEKLASANGSGKNTPASSSTPVLAAAKQSVLPHLAKLREDKYSSTKGVPTIHQPLMDDDVIGALDLDIDVEI
ncbi:hypothetical protein S7711_06306 [Stachybotrys chartarum IBT 7711]|uniref:Plus3 domain-containing protein n=1 Tax=Stachybotrys chartarum (strain CBS 109288 / IBT 7711) TaxID=1280523 RepID=A0A084B851_STACB|nr:hypothetical protein S7711_06306 [Stachybotrys chartarum IBT 7711]KFA47288.1 hypothetical protein S40293_08307 [Stachybotrys chartarum IBT 40293]KFA74536.1 hypothetical protein S40288_04886 [Stachybotrys chartarum IBT 40288]